MQSTVCCMRVCIRVCITPYLYMVYGGFEKVTGIGNTLTSRPCFYVVITLNRKIVANSKFHELAPYLIGGKIRD